MQPRIALADDLSGAAPAAAASPVTCRYLLVIHIPVYVDREGRRWTERLWQVDLDRHVEYIRHLTVCCPFIEAEPPADCVPLDERVIRFEPIPWSYPPLPSTLEAPLALWRAWRLIGRHDFVHSHYGWWWPLATPYLVNLVAWLRGSCLLINVEASPWRIVRGEQASAWRRFKACVAEALNRWTLSLADIAFFTHEGYRRDLLPRGGDHAHVVQASWIDAAVVQDRATAQARWQARLAPGSGPPRLLFAGRLDPDKGVLVLLEAIERLRAQGQTPLHVSIIGAGELAGVCREHAARSDGCVRLELLEPVAYGQPFFELLRRFDAIVVPSLADEQPRIVYDAYSQAVPALASATPGLVACVKDGATGRLFAPADADALAAAMREAAGDLPSLQRMGLAALTAARSMTHQEMHRRRHVLISTLLAARAMA
jgi:glycosyltransferase involved in cell wall biosynthesis